MSNRIIPSTLDNQDGCFLAYGVVEVEPGLYRYSYFKATAESVIVNEQEYRGEVDGLEG